MSERSSRAPSHLASNNRPQDGSSPSVPTRIILKLLVKDFDSNGYSWFDYPSAVGAYLDWAKRPLAEWKEKKHNVFVEPFQDIEVQQNKFHVIIDLLALSFEVKNMDEVNHEIYEIKRNGEGELDVREAKNPAVAQNIISKTRQFTDRFYPWGSEAWEKAQ